MVSVQRTLLKMYNDGDGVCVCANEHRVGQSSEKTHIHMWMDYWCAYRGATDVHVYVGR